MSTYKTPGVYIEEISTLPSSVVGVESAIPVFIGYTQKAGKLTDGDLRNRPARVSSFSEFQQFFGQPYPEMLSVTVKDKRGGGFTSALNLPAPTYLLWHCMALFYANGGGDCFVVSIGDYRDSPEFSVDRLRNGLDAIRVEDEPTLIVIPEAVNLSETGFGEIAQAVLQQCAILGDRFGILDIHDGCTVPEDIDWPRQRSLFGNHHLEYGAAYYPFLSASRGLDSMEDEKVIVRYRSSRSSDTLPLSKWKEKNEALFKFVKRELGDRNIDLPPSAAIAGIYARVDNERGVWKAPANVDVRGIRGPTLDIDHAHQESMNIDPVSGKSINAIRTFPGKGTLVWGARTLDGNSLDWRYVNVKRLFLMVEESTKKATAWVVFEPNDGNTWSRVRAMIENYLTQQLRDGALAGAKSDEAFFVHCGLGTTMTQQDILEGRLNIVIGLAAVRPAEFIILQFSHKMQTA